MDRYERWNTATLPVNSIAAMRRALQVAVDSTRFVSLAATKVLFPVHCEFFLMATRDSHGRRIPGPRTGVRQ